jgi:hypothetical protein
MSNVVRIKEATENTRRVMTHFLDLKISTLRSLPLGGFGVGAETVNQWIIGGGAPTVKTKKIITSAL